MWWLFACAPEPCPPDAFPSLDGRCYVDEEVVEAPTADDVVAGFWDCPVTEGNGRLDPAAGCADGVCVGDAYATVVTVLGPEARCYAVASSDARDDAVRFRLCEWLGGLRAGFPAVPDEADPLGWRPDPLAASTWPLSFSLDYTGTSAEGLGVHAPLSCWIEALGPPTIGIEGTGGETEPWLAIWSPIGLYLLADAPDESDGGPPWQMIFRVPR
ncbi:MAG: hypothetical protein Q8P18_22650 [Pseudomonadota bacterium]|nr:hypothetical protein [Pseudomonadota bacterium]